MSTPPLPEPQFQLPSLPELRNVTVSGRRICYYDSGAGSSLVLIHGIGSDADEWAFCLGALGAAHRVVALDLPGFGRSDKPAIEYNVAGFVDTLRGFLQALGIERVSLMGSSLGGWITAAFALRFPAMVDKAILVDAAGLFSDVSALPVDLRVSTREHLREVFQHVFHDPRLVSDALIDLSYRLHLERGDGPTIENVLQNLQHGRERLDESVRSLKAPTLIVWGEQDAMIPVATARSFQRLIAGSQMEIIPQCGHLPALEKPAELVQRVLQFLSC
jgi:triacylglycerol lipase